MKPTPTSNHRKLTVRKATDDRLAQLSEISGMPKAEIVARAVESFDPKVVKFAEAMNRSSAPATQREDSEAQPQTSVSANE